MTEIRVIAYAGRLLKAAAAGGNYLEALQSEARASFAHEPWSQRAIRTAVRGSEPPEGIDTLAGLKAIAESGMELVAHRELERLVALADPGTPGVECHLFPCLNPELRGGGLCYAPGKMLVQVPLIEHWPLRVVRNLTHEYSHTLRGRLWPSDERYGYGPAYRYRIRDFLVFEGLADNLVEESHPHPAFAAPRPDAGVIGRFWEAVLPHQDLEHWDAYRVLMTPGPDFPRGIGYAMGYTVVRRFLERTGMTALEAHRLPYAEILPALG